MKDTPQIKAIIKAILTGKCNNIYAARNKIKTLRIKQRLAEQKRQYQNYLSL